VHILLHDSVLCWGYLPFFKEDWLKWSCDQDDTQRDNGLGQRFSNLLLHHPLFTLDTFLSPQNLIKQTLSTVAFLKNFN